MIRSVAIQNFQSHKDTLLAFHPGINAIVGDSDKGKTAVVRAILWNITNRPNGLHLISDWIQTAKGAIKAGESAQVKVVTDKGSPMGITRVRSDKINGYETPEGPLEAIRMDVPPVVEEHFNMNEVNIQRQMDAPFLLSYTAGEASRFINRLIRMEDIDLMLTKAESRRQASARKIKALQEEITTGAEAVAELNWVGGLSEAVDKAEATQKEMEALGALVARLSPTVERYTEAQQKVRDLAMPLVLAGNHVETAEKLIAELSQVSRQVNLVRPALDNWMRTTVEWNKADTFVKEAQPVAEALEAISSERDALQQRVTSLNGSTDQWNRAHVVSEKSGDIATAEKAITKASNIAVRVGKARETARGLTDKLVQYRNLAQVIIDQTATIDELEKELPEKCPTCNQYKDASHAQTH